MLYLMQDHAVYGIDLNSSEYIVLADSLEEEGYAVSQDGRHFAWQDDQKQHQASYISLMDLETGTKQTISAPEGDSYPQPWICRRRFPLWTGAPGQQMDG